MDRSTIAAVATGTARCAIGIVRLSGPGAIAAAAAVFDPAAGGSLAGAPDRTLVRGVLRDREGNAIDRPLATVSRAPHSYTGEDTAELHCHGSPTVLALALEALYAQGVRPAPPGQFTRRAFLNGKLDLAQAEAVADLIDAETAESARHAAGQLGGALSRRVEGIYDGLVDLMAHFHAVLDWPDEDIGPFEAAEISAALDRAGRALDGLLSTCRRGRMLVQGIPCAIVGRPNAGKSTLFNALLGYERAIVTDVPGTTRDTVEERVSFGGVLLRLIDTAGLREAEDRVERLGVERSRAAMERAELILAVVDGSADTTGEDLEILRAVEETGKPWIFVSAKKDLTGSSRSMGCVIGSDDGPAVRTGPKSALAASVELSALTGQGMDELERAVAALFPEPPASEAGELLTNARQEEAARRAREALSRAEAALEAGVTPDAVLTDVEEALSALGELTGRTVRADVTDRIFQRFCVGK